MNRKQEDIIGGIIIVLLFLLVIGAGLYQGVYQKSKLKKDYRVTIAVITKREYPADGGEIAKIRYKVENKLYFGFFSIDNTKKVTPPVGARFFIKYHPPDPDIALIIDNMLVPDSLIAPLNGWKEIPVKIHREDY